MKRAPDPGVESDMDELRRVSRRAVMRARLRRFVRAAGVSLSIAMGAAVVVLLADRLVGPGVAWWWIFGPAAVAALVYAALVATVLRRVDAVEATSEVDEALRLKDRLASALALGEREPNDPFVGLAVEEATALAGKVNVRKAIPVKGDGWWWTWPVLAAAALGVGIFVPQLGLLSDRQAEAARVQRIAQREAAASDIEKTTRDLEMTLKGQNDPGVADPLTKEKLSRLDELREQLTKGDKGADDARSEAAGVLGDLADRFAKEAQQREMEGQSVRDLFQNLETGDQGADKDAVDKLADAMRRADADGVKQAADELEKAIKEMSPEERAKTAERLRKLAKQLDDLAKQAEERAAERRKRIEEQLKQQGMPASDAESMANQPDQEKLDKDLRDRGLDEENARRLSESIAEQNRQRKADKEAADRARDASKSLDEASRQAEQPPKPPESTPPKGAEQDKGVQQDKQEQGPKSEQRKPGGAEQQRPGQQQQQQQGQEGRQGQPQQGQEGQEGQRGEPKEGEGKSGEKREGAEGQQQQPGSQPRSLGPDASKPEGAKPSPDNASPNAPEGSQQGERPSSQGQARPGQQEGKPEEGAGQPQPGQGKPQPSEGQGQTPGDESAPAKRVPGSGDEGQKPDGQEGTQGAPGSAPKPTGEQGEKPGASGEKQGEQKGQEQGATPEGAEGAGGGAEKPEDAHGAGGSSDRPDAEKQPGSGGGEGTSQQKRNSPGGAPGADENARDGGGAGSSGSQGLDKLRKQFEQMQKRQRNGQMTKQRAEELRKQAEQMLDKMSPEERKKLDRWARDMMREQNEQAAAGGTPDYNTEPVDARRGGEGGQVVGEMNADKSTPPPDPSLVSKQQFAEQMAGSLQSAEKAMEERVVPTRYSNVARYFRQALERMKKEAAQSAPAPEGPIQPAQDVPAKNDGK